MSARARDQILKAGKRPLRFIGNEARNVLKPEWISPQIERQRARVARSAGSRPAFGRTSLRYSPIASVSHTVTSSWVRQGTRIEAESSRISARVAGSSGGISFSSKSRPENFVSSQPRSDHDE